MPVGQGGFHVGGLSWACSDLCQGSAGQFTGAPFLYVYDCGSEPKRQVNREIKTLREARPDRRLDLLVLSHFDRDHICGVPHLLSRNDGFKIDTILLPFVAMDERIAALAQAAAETRENGGYIDRFFIDIVFDPIGTLSRFEPRRIILVHSSDDGAPLRDEGSPDLDPSFPALTAEIDSDRARDRRPRSIKMALVDAYGDRQRPSRYSYVDAGGPEILEVRNLALAVSDSSRTIEWKLLPWVRAAAAADIAAFRSTVETLFGWPARTFAMKVLDPVVRKQMVTTKRTQLAAAYKKAFANKNLTSLCLYSGPRFPERAEAIPLKPAIGPHPLTKIGWMGTGDAHLKDTTDIAAFRRGYAREIDFVSTYLFPHHGSLENSDPANLIVDADMWVAAADPIHPWLHPHWKLQQAVHQAAKLFYHVRASPYTAANEVFLVFAKPYP